MVRAVHYRWVDNVGQTADRTHFAATNPCGILNQLQAVSRAGVAWNFDAPLDGTIGAPSAGAYPSVRDQCTLLFAKADGSYIRLRFVAPDDSIFLPDGITVDPTAIATLIAACVGELSDQAGNVAASFVAGFRE